MNKKLLVKVQNLSTGYGKKVILDSINFDINSNEIVGLIGSNGCGKTTLIKSVCRIIPSQGEIIIEDKNSISMSSKVFAQNVSLVPQKSGISIDISVLDVVLMGFNPFLAVLNRPDSSMILKAEELLKLFGLYDRRLDSFQDLSEGQKQLVIIARSLVADTKILFMDEPESSLDFAVRYSMMNILKNEIKSKNKCALVSLHDVNLALKFCDKLLLIKDGKIASTVNLIEEDINSIESKLQNIYGSVRLLTVKDNDDNESLVMVKV